MTELSNAFVVVMGMGTVFIGLICIVLICMLMSFAIKMFTKTPVAAPTAAPAAKAVALDSKTKAEIIAGACACIAEELGEDASNIKVVSFKQI